MNNFANSMRAKANMTVTENGADVYSTTQDAVLDLFARIGGLRDESPTEIERLWLAARLADKELADNMVLYARDVRNGGIGERRIGRILLKTLALVDHAKVERNFDTIVNAGRWDDLFIFEGTKAENAMMEFVKNQFRKDIIAASNDEPISLLAKWLPSCNTSSSETRRLARKFYTYFGINERTYRKTLSSLRKHLNIVEKRMSAQEFNLIDYKTVPSQAMTRYRSAFGKHDFERFNDYIQAVIDGRTKINASVSYPYELISPYVNSYVHYYRDIAVDPVLEAQWKALPNYVEGNQNVVVMADVSGSMSGRPMETAVSLGIYFAERNQGDYHNLIMTFTDVPTLYELKDNETLAEKVAQVKSHVGYNTDLNKAFEAIYTIAERCKEVPRALVIISDGEIDSYCERLIRHGTCVEDIVEKWQRKYSEIGLEAPKLVMWNVNSRGARFIAPKFNKGVSYVSGSSASTFKEMTNLITKDAVEAMITILTKSAFCWR